MKTLTPAAQLAGFIAKFSPEVAAVIKASRTKMRRRLPHASELVYDNYNFFVIGYGHTERPSEAIFSIAAHARGVTFCFLHGAKVPDPKKILRGTGHQVRNIQLPAASVLDHSEVQALITSAIAQAPVPFHRTARPRLIIKSISAKQRPRRVAPRSAKSPPSPSSVIKH